MLNIHLKLNIKHYIIATLFFIGLFAFLFSQISHNFSNAAESTIGSGASPLPARKATTLRGCWTNTSASYAAQCDDIDINSDGSSDYSVCGYGDTAICTMDFDTDYNGNPDSAYTGKELDCNTCQWASPAPAACQDSDYTTSCTYSSCTRTGGTKTCSKNGNAPSTCTTATRSWTGITCPTDCTSSTQTSSYQYNTGGHSCTGDGKRIKTYTSTAGSCRPSADEVVDCIACTGSGSGAGQYTSSTSYSCTTNGRYTTTYTATQSDCIPPTTVNTWCTQCTDAQYTTCSWPAKCSTTDRGRSPSPPGHAEVACTAPATERCMPTATASSTSFSLGATRTKSRDCCTPSDYTLSCKITGTNSTCSTADITSANATDITTPSCSYSKSIIAGRTCIDIDLTSTETSCCVGNVKSCTANRCVRTVTSGAVTGVSTRTCKTFTCSNNRFDGGSASVDEALGSCALACNNPGDYDTTQWPVVEECPASPPSKPGDNKHRKIGNPRANTNSTCTPEYINIKNETAECCTTSYWNCATTGFNSICNDTNKGTNVRCVKVTCSEEGATQPPEPSQVYCPDDTASPPSATLPQGRGNGSTLRFNGSAWSANNTIFNNGSIVGIGGGFSPTALPATTLEIKTATTDPTRVRLTDTANNPEMQFQYSATDQWVMYVFNSAPAGFGTGTTQVTDKSFRIKNGTSDIVRIKTDGTLYTSQICLTSTVTTDEVAGSSKCITTWPTGGGGGESYWSQDSTSKVLSYTTGSVNVGALNVTGTAGITLGEDKASGTANTAGTFKMYSVGDNAFSTTFITGTQTADAIYTLPTASVDGLLKNTSGTLSWDASSYVTSVATANGVSATNTAGALTFSLSAITPSTVNGLTLSAAATGFTIAGGTTPKTLTVSDTASITGTNTGDQNLSGYGLKSGKLNQFATTTSAELAGIISDETGTGLAVFATSPTLTTPTFTTSIITPLVLGGAAVDKILTLQGNNATTGNTLTSPNIQFKVGDGGGITAMTILNSGKVGIGTNAPSTLLSVAGAGQNPSGSNCPAGTEYFNENGNTTMDAGECKPSIAFDPENGALRISKGAGADKVLVSDANGNGKWATKTFSQWITSGSDIYYNLGKVGVGTKYPEKRFVVAGDTATNPACTSAGFTVDNTSRKCTKTSSPDEDPYCPNWADTNNNELKDIGECRVTALSVTSDATTKNSEVGVGTMNTQGADFAVKSGLYVYAGTDNTIFSTSPVDTNEAMLNNGTARGGPTPSAWTTTPTPLPRDSQLTPSSNGGFQPVAPPVTIATPTAPATPTNVGAVLPKIGTWSLATYVVVTWSPSSEAISYKIWRSKRGVEGFQTTLAGTSTNPSYTDNSPGSISNPADIQYAVSAVNAIGESSRSTPVVVQIGTTDTMLRSASMESPMTPATAVVVPPVAPPISSPVVKTYIGCYYDDSSRMGGVSLGSNKSVEDCAAAASGGSTTYPYFWLEYGGECWASQSLGDSRAYPRQNESDCSYPCSANTTEKCGGYWRGSVYALGNTTEPTKKLEAEQGLIGYYPFEDGIGTTITDRSAYRHNAIATASVWTDGMWGKSLSFNGSQYAEISGTSPSTNVSFSAWIKPDGKGGNIQNIIGGPGSIFEYVSVFGQFSVFDGVNWRRSATYIPNDQWTHVALTFDGSARVLKLYVYGKLETTFNGSTYSNGKITTIGAYATDGNRGFSGAIDDLRIYNRVLSDQEIDLLYQKNTAVSVVSAIKSSLAQAIHSIFK